QYILYKLEILKETILESYKNFEFHTIYHSISNFFVIDLSSFYLSIIKDNIYCNSKSSKERRSAQTIVFKLLSETALFLAPILSFTSEEVWAHIPDFKDKGDSIHLKNFPAIDKSGFESGHEKWEALIMFRNNILKEIENARNEKIIGDSLEADVELSLSGDMYKIISNDSELLKKITVVSGLKISSGSSEKIIVKKYIGEKCPRCWNWFKPLNDKEELCPRCSEVVKEMDIELH
ncbi:MAG: class I tRNA ligase family protein, partial [Candidatus Aminicenantes bacterium]|nr:class I tRNA ligase family protein [Candidatus Aminicenantes bacterium]